MRYAMHISYLISGRQMFIHASLMTTCLVAITKKLLHTISGIQEFIILSNYILFTSQCITC